MRPATQPTVLPLEDCIEVRAHAFPHGGDLARVVELDVVSVLVVPPVDVPCVEVRLAVVAPDHGGVYVVYLARQTQRADRLRVAWV